MAGGTSQVLLAYRRIPKKSTGATPAFMIFGRELKTKLPQLKREKPLVDEATREVDWRRKVTGKLIKVEQPVPIT